MSEDKKSITIADLIACIAITVLAFTEGYGLYLVGNSGIISLLIGLCFWGVFVAIWFFLIKAKTTKESPKFWRKAEVGGLIIYFVVAAVLFGEGSVLFSSIYSNRASFSNAEASDLDQIKTMYSQYEEERSEALRNAIEMLKNFEILNEKDRKRYPLYKYYELYKDDKGQVIFDFDITNEWDNITKLNTNVSDSVEIMNKIVKSLKTFPGNGIHNLTVYLNTNMDTVNGAYKKLEEHIKSYTTNSKTIPEIQNNYDWNKEDGYFKFEYNLPQSEFVEKIKECENFSKDWLSRLKYFSLWYWLWHLLVIFCYIVTHRNRFVGLDRKDGIGGLPLIVDNNENNK